MVMKIATKKVMIVLRRLPKIYWTLTMWLGNILAVYIISFNLIFSVKLFSFPFYS